jgi:O-antigen/teichoic acid export membrane protein
MKPARTILLNFLNLSAGEAIARLVNFAAFAHLARVLGSSDFGRIGFVMTIVTYLLIPVMQGFDSVGIRDVARDRDRLRAYAGSILLIRALSALVTWTAVVAAVSFFPLEPPMPVLVKLFGLLLFPGALSLKWAFQAVEQTRPVAVAGIVAQLGFAAGAFTIAGPEQLLRVPVCALAGESAGALLLMAAFVGRFGWFRPVLETRFWQDLFRESAPLAASTVLGTLLFNFDVLALGWLQPASAVGVYTAIYKLILLFSTVLTLFQLSLFPSLARASREGRELAPMAAKVLRFVTAAFLPLAFAGGVMARPLLAFLFGAEYAAGATALRILLWSLPWMALRSVFRIILVSYNLQRLDLRAVAAGAVTNVVLDLILVPGLGIVGAAISTLSSEIVILHQSYRYVRHAIEPIYILGHFVKPLMASLFMLVPGLLMRGAPLGVQAVSAAALYLSALFFVRGITWKEIAALYRG